MSKIEIRGVIVPSDYDGGWFQQLADRGVIHPESKFRRELAAAKTGEPLEVYLNTPGGSVFAGNEMVNAVLAWKAQTKQKVNIVLGAMTASMGAAFVVQVADDVKAFQNSMMMFHGAWGANIGGSESMADYSDLLNKINEGTKSVLLSRYNLSPAQVDEWFAEGREGWLTAKDMIETGIISGIIGQDDAAIDTKDIDLAVAAMAKAKDVTSGGAVAVAAQNKKEGEMNDGKGSEGSEGTADGGGAAGKAGEGEQMHSQEPVMPEAGTAEDQKAVIDLEKIKAESFEEGKNKAQAELLPKLQDCEKKLTEAKANASKLQSERDRLAADLVKVTEEMALKVKDAENRLANLLGGSVSFSPAVDSWEDALKACGGKYAEAAKKFPELRREYEKRNMVKG